MYQRIRNFFSSPMSFAAATLMAFLVVALASGVHARSIREATANPADAQAAIGQTDGAGGQGDDYRLGNGDKVRITVFNQRDLTDIYQVDGLGRIAFPLVGQIDVGGLTPKQLEQKLAKVLSPDYVKNPHISVVVLSFRPFYIIGEVTKPGSYPYVSGMSMINAVALAGGFTYRADEDSFDLMRPDKSGKKVKISAKPETPVQPGDVITVNERIF
jgi:protein involved in polysaccharide export with SLBB domain